MSKKKILVVDDDTSITLSISFVLEKEGYAVIIAVDGEEAVKKAKEELPHLIVLDIMLPKINGFEVCKRLKANVQTREIRIIMLTAKGDEKDKRLAEKLGVNGYITKPFNIDTLLSEIRKGVANGEK